MNELIKKKISNSLKGKKKSATHRKNISQALTGRKLNKEHKEKIKEDSGTEGASKTLSGITHRIINGIEKKAEKCNKRHTPHKSPFLAENSHGKVGVLFGQKAQLALCTGLKTLAEHFT